ATTNATLAIVPVQIPSGLVGDALPTVTFQATGGSGSTTFELASGALPAGVTLSASGVLGGTPSAAGSFPFRVRASSADGQTATLDRVLRVRARLAVSPLTLPEGVVGRPYTTGLAAT